MKSKKKKGRVSPVMIHKELVMFLIVIKAISQYYWMQLKVMVKSGNKKLHTSLLRAEAAVVRSAGSMERRTSINAKAGGGKSLNVSATHRL